MRYGTNPLFPTSDGGGVKGGYEQAALIDDSSQTFGKDKSKQTRSKTDFEFILYKSERRGEFSRNQHEIVRNYKRGLKKLKQQKRTGKISSDEYRKLKRILIEKTDIENRTAFRNFLLGK